MADNILKISSDYVNGVDKLTTSSIYAVDEVYKIEDLRIWQCARTISKDIYTITRRENFEKDFRFVQQMRAAAGSIMDNIAEGYGRMVEKNLFSFYISPEVLVKN